MSTNPIGMNVQGTADVLSRNTSVPESSARDYFTLMKPHVMQLVVFTAACGLILAPGSIHPFVALLSILCIAVAAGASAALNNAWDADIDQVMKRTMNRPTATGRIAPSEALAFGLVMSILSVMLMGLATNWVAAGLLALTIAFYVFVYTMWLKRSTPQNIVIGGAAGAFPPMIGWAAVTGEVGLFPIVLFLIIFFWTPPHFWALSLYRAKDYESVGVPMLPVVAGRAATGTQILIYGVILSFVALSPVVLGYAGWVYAMAALALNSRFLQLCVKTWRTDDNRIAKKTFAFSIPYLFGIFIALVADHMVRLAFGGGA